MSRIPRRFVPVLYGETPPWPNNGFGGSYEIGGLQLSSFGASIRSVLTSRVFYCAAAKFAVELDGDVHGAPQRKEADTNMDAYVRSRGVRVLRFWNFQLNDNEEGVLAATLIELESRTAGNPHPDPLPCVARERGQSGSNVNTKGS